MRNDDVALIQRILTGDENAFESLIRKYEKQVHALAFRKVGDFQTAEDITQETFLQVHQKLATLNDPAKFSGWLYAIANHLCIAWYRKNRLQTEALQEIYISEIETGGIFSVYCEGTCENNCRSATRFGQKPPYQVEREGPRGYHTSLF